MKLNKEYPIEQLRRWSFSDICTYRTEVWAKYLKYNEDDMKMINEGLRLIDSAYRVAVKVTLDGVTLDETILDELKMSVADLQAITRYRALLMSRMAALPPDILKTMANMRQLFQNY